MGGIWRCLGFDFCNRLVVPDPGMPLPSHLIQGHPLGASLSIIVCCDEAWRIRNRLAKWARCATLCGSSQRGICGAAGAGRGTVGQQSQEVGGQGAVAGRSSIVAQDGGRQGTAACWQAWWQAGGGRPHEPHEPHKPHHGHMPTSRPQGDPSHLPHSHAAHAHTCACIHTHIYTHVSHGA